MFENPYDILSPEEAMDELRIGKNSIYELLNSGKLKGFKITGNENVLQKVTATGFFAFLNINGVGTDIIITAN